jgi:diacylglycerol kinase family enzyme
MRTAVLINPRSGKARNAVELDTLIKSANDIPETRVKILNKHEDPCLITRNFLMEGITRVAAAGGDGTISSVANELAGKNASLIPVPFGTLNHFCTDLGVHQDPIIALKALTSSDAHEMLIDMGCVNSRYFLDNSSLGLYPHLVKRRVKWQKWMGKWPAYIIAALEMARYPVCLRIETPLENDGLPLDASLIFISNNVMDGVLPSPGRRKKLDEGILQVYVLRSCGLWQVLSSAAAFLRGKVHESTFLNEHRLQSCTIHLKRKGAARISCDGEIFTAQPPIRYEIKKKALSVRFILQDSNNTEHKNAGQ